MKQIALLLCLAMLLAGCRQTPVETQPTETPTQTVETTAATEPPTTEATETVPTETVPEETAPAAEPDDSDLVIVKDYIPDILVELKYATSDNFTGQAVYDFQDVYLRYGTVKKLMAVQQELKGMGLRLKIWDGFRPVSAQQALWEICPDPTFVSDPKTGTRSHCRGSAVDVTLAEANGIGVEMPSGFDDFTGLGDRDYDDCTEEAAKNAQLLEAVMEKHGFQGYASEWWHYADTEEYPVEEYFDPAVLSVCYAVCNEYISLRTQPDTSAEVITRIGVGEEMLLLGYTGDFAVVQYNGQQGFVLAGYLVKAESADGNSDVGDDVSLNKPQYYADCQNFISLRAEADVRAEVITQIPAGGRFLVLEWSGDFALVDYDGLRGYVLIDYIQPVQ